MKPNLYKHTEGKHGGKRRNSSRNNRVEGISLLLVMTVKIEIVNTSHTFNYYVLITSGWNTEDDEVYDGKNGIKRSWSCRTVNTF